MAEVETQLRGLAICHPPTFYHCPGNWSWRPPALHVHHLWVIYGGRGWLKLNGQRHDLQSGCLVLMRPGEQPQADHDAAFPLHVFACHFQFADGRSLASDWPLVQRVGDIPFLETLTHRILRTMRSHSSKIREQARLCLQLLLVMMREESSPLHSSAERVELAADWIHQAPGSFRSIEEVSRKAGLSPAYFSRSFKERFGATPARYWLQQKVAKAAFLLRSTDTPMEEIAAITGFSDLSHFSRRFLEINGTRPGAYRNEWRK